MTISEALERTDEKPAEMKESVIKKKVKRTERVQVENENWLREARL